MDNKLSELSKPIGVSFKSDIELMKSGRMIHGQMTVWKSRVGIPDSQEGVYSQEYVSALLAELEAKDQAHRVHAARLISERGVLRERVTELEAKLATPVQLPDPDENDYGYQSISYLQAIDAINDAGFTVEGDE